MRKKKPLKNDDEIIAEIEKKIWPKYFELVKSGKKRKVYFEV